MTKGACVMRNSLNLVVCKKGWREGRNKRRGRRKRSCKRFIGG